MSNMEVKGSVLASMINRWYYHDEFKPVIVYGQMRIGKSSYALKVAREVYGDWETVKKYVVYTPQEFLDKCLNTTFKKPLLIWDDAGLWLFAYDYIRDPLLPAIIKYLNVAGTQWATIIFTTPTTQMLVKRIRTLPHTVTIKIIKNKDEGNKKLRIARAYVRWVSPDTKRHGVRKIFEDHFDAMLPNDFYNWYYPMRQKYVNVALDMIREIIQKRPSVSKIIPSLKI